MNEIKYEFKIQTEKIPSQEEIDYVGNIIASRFLDNEEINSYIPVERVNWGVNPLVELD